MAQDPPLEELTIILSPSGFAIPEMGISGREGFKQYRGTQPHRCGLQGYNPMLGDACPGCDESAYHRGLAVRAERAWRAYFSDN